MIVELDVLKLQSSVSNEPFILLLQASTSSEHGQVQFATVEINKNNLDLLMQYSNAIEMIQVLPETKDLKINCVQAYGIAIVPEWHEEATLDEIVEESTVPVCTINGVYVTLPSNLNQYTSSSPDYRSDATLNAYISYGNDLIKNGYVYWEGRNKYSSETVDTDPISKKTILGLYKLFS